MPAVPTTPRVKLRSSSRRVPRTHAARTTLVPETESEPNMRLSRAILVMLLLHVVAVGGIFAFSFIKERDPNRSPNGPMNSASSAVEAEETALPAKRGTGDTPRVKPEGVGGNGRPAVHVVRAGETLTRIANDHGVTLEALVAVNGADTVTNGLHPGQELKLPDKSPVPDAPAVDSTANALAVIEGRNVAGTSGTASSNAASRNGHLPPDSGKFYVVGKGESPYVIAQKLKVNYDALLKLNGIDDPKKLKPGQKLRVPAPTKPHGKP